MKEIINTENAPPAIGPYSQATRGNGFIFVSGQLPLHPISGEVASSIEAQTAQVLDNLKAILEAGGSSLKKVLKTTVFLNDMNNFTLMNQVYQQYFTADHPARICVEVARLPKDVWVEIDATALV